MSKLNDGSADANRLAADSPDELVNGVTAKAGVIVERLWLGWVVIDGVDSVIERLFLDNWNDWTEPYL